MKKRPLSILVLIVLTTGMLAGVSIQQPVQNQDTEIKNVIILIGDGMGFEHLRLGSYVEYGNDSGLFMQQPEFAKGNMTTFSANDEITDSAASGTAIATGYKTDNGKIAQLPNGTNVPTILEYAQDNNKKTGLVSTAYFYHATPAAFAAHQDSRYDYQPIITQMLESDTDLILGGGPYENLATVVNFDTKIEENNYTHITSKSELDNIGQNKTLGTFRDDHLKYEADLDVSTDVRLHQLTDAALSNLDNEDGFFLMVEGARIDHAGHINNATRNALEVIEFDRTVELVHRWVQDNPDTLVIVTADHETGGLAIDSTSGLGDILPSDEASEQEAQERRISRAGQIETSYANSYHTAQNVPVFAFGKGADSLFDQEQYDNTDMYDIMKDGYEGIGVELSTTTSEQSSLTSSTTSDSESSIISETTEAPFATFVLLFVITIPLLKRKYSNVQ